ncbi:uncharacterized protein LOC143450670 isoform X1 [Clavelina lepadiformis]|uniref:uncharacterized protein LOC143450670 isoform X1 n=1 Tax=Clavelina lepadiformis TaxID=159417 RepID=UPI0040417007
MDMQDEESQMEEDILKLQLHSIPLNLNWTQNDPEEEDDDDDEGDDDVPGISLDYRPSNLNPTTGSTLDPNQPSTSTAGISHEEFQDEAGNSEVDSQDEASDEEELIDLSADFEPTPLNLLKLNFAYQEVIEQQIATVDRLLHENHYKTSMLMENMDLNPKKAKKPAKLEYALFKRQFFKDEGGYGPPNIDLERRGSELGSHFVPYVMPCPKWTKTTEAALLSGVEKNARRSTSEPIMTQLEYLQEKYKNNPTTELQKKIEDSEKKLEKVHEIPISDLMGNCDSPWDWYSISNVDLENSQTAGCCRLHWKNNSCPSINKGPWTEEEDKKLVYLVAKHKNLDWNVIASELESNRVPIQVLQRYQQKINTFIKHRPWTPEEDEKLIQLVNKFKVGNCVPYSQISFHHGGRSATQVCHRWTKTVDPSFKRTRFTPEEDAKLFRAVVLYGTRWSVIRDLGIIPNRNDAQLRERYMNSLIDKRCEWTKSEDGKLAKLVKQLGEGNWAVIAKELTGRTDCQCLRRWTTIKKYKAEGREVLYPRRLHQMNGITKVRRELARAICQEHIAVKKESDGDATASGKFKIPLAMAKLNGLHDIDYQNDKRTCKILKSLSPDMSSEEVIKLYHEILKPRRYQSRKPRMQRLADKNLNDDIFETLFRLYQPYRKKMLDEKNPLTVVLSKIERNSEGITPKSIFISFVKALNINAEKALDTIKHNKVKKSNVKITQIKMKDLLRNQLTQDGANKPGKRKQQPRLINSDEKSGSDAKTSQTRTFVRNLYLPVTAPNRGTIRGYRELCKHRETRVKRAKTILDLPDDENKDKETDINDVETKSTEKFKTDQLLTHLRSTYKYKILRSRFNALFTWPTLLSSLVPYTRRQSDKLLMPTVRTKRTLSKEAEEFRAKKQKLS